MRICYNCKYGSYGLDCNSGVETLYCTENGYDHETEPDNICELHQFINGYEDEKNYLLYDESYLGPGYFIIYKQREKITKFLKLYMINDSLIPNYGLRAFSIDGKDNLDLEYNSIEFVFRSNEDFDNKLFDVFLMFSKQVNEKIETIDSLEQGKNNILLEKHNGIIKFIVSKDVIRGKQHPTDYIDINLGDNYTCKNYEAINNLYNALSSLLPPTLKEEDIKQIIKVNQ